MPRFGLEPHNAANTNVNSKNDCKGPIVTAQGERCLRHDSILYMLQLVKYIFVKKKTRTHQTKFYYVSLE